MNKYPNAGVTNLRISHTEEKILGILNTRWITIEGIAKEMGKGYNKQHAANLVLRMARKGFLDKTKAALLLHDMPNTAKFLEI